VPQRRAHVILDAGFFLLICIVIVMLMLLIKHE
jgi:hypothetical protein